MRGWIAAIGAGVLAGCSGGATPAGEPEAVLSAREVVLAIGERVAVPEAGLTVGFEGVPQDQRCPIPWQCLVAGNADVALRIDRTGTERPDTVVVLSSDRPELIVAVDGVRLELRSLIPQPRAERPTPPGEYRAGIRISRLAP